MAINKTTILERGEMRFQCSYQYKAWFLCLAQAYPGDRKGKMSSLM